MDATTLAAGVADKIDDFATQYGPVVLTVIGIALGLYGLKFAYGWFTTHVRVRAKAS